MCLDFGMLQVGMVCDGDKAGRPPASPEHVAARMRRNITVADAEAAHINRRHEDGSVSRLRSGGLTEPTCYGALPGETGHPIIEGVRR